MLNKKLRGYNTLLFNVTVSCKAQKLKINPFWTIMDRRRLEALVRVELVPQLDRIIPIYIHVEIKREQA